jgi:hypothetical protein
MCYFSKVIILYIAGSCQASNLLARNLGLSCSQSGDFKALQVKFNVGV